MSARTTARVALGILAVTGLFVGVWATAAPHSFFSSFPGGGHMWAASDGPYNEHLVRDVGDLNLALVAVTLCACVWWSRALAAAAALAWLVYSVPHLTYHAFNLQTVSGDDQVAELVSLAIPIVLAACILVAVRSAREAGPTEPSGTPVGR
jgi:hypothetical protein